MTPKMQAAVVEQFGKPLVLREVDIPSAGPGQIIVKTEACGVCHTDLHAASGDFPLKAALPFIPGHEAIGRVTAIGAGVTAVKEGDRVGVPWLYSACGHCEYCLTAWETVCAEARFGGYTRNGGFAEYILADPNYVAHIPAGLTPTAAAPLICAGITSYKGIKETRAKPGEWIAISGIGGLGHLAIQYARAMGLKVCAVDIDDGKLAHAKQLGAHTTINAKTVADAAEAVKQATDGGAHGVLITAPSLGAFTQGVGMTRKRGTCVLVGLPPGAFPTPLFDVVANCITIRGSFVGNRQDMAESLAFAAAGQVKADIELQPLAAINQIFERLAHGDVPSRVVLDFAASCARRAASSGVNPHSRQMRCARIPAQSQQGNAMKPRQAQAPIQHAVSDDDAIDRSHQRTLDAIFRHPAAHNLEWGDAIALFAKIGAVEHRHNNEFAFSLGGRQHLLRKPHSKDLDGSEVAALRHFLQQAGWSAAGAPHVSAEAAAAVAATAATAASLMVVVDHHGAKIYRIDDDESADEANAQAIAPYDPHHFLHHLTHKDQDRELGQRAPEDISFYQRIAEALASGDKIVVVGHGTGHSNAAQHLTEYLRTHDHATYARIARELVADLSSITLPQLHELAYKALH